VIGVLALLFSFLFVVLPGQAQSSEVSSASHALSASEGKTSAAAPRALPTPKQLREPSAREVIQMALDAARGLGPERILELSRRARLAGLMPQLKLSAERGLKQDLSSSTTALSDRVNAAVGDDLRLGATLTFDLDRLVFAPEEVRLLSVERWLAIDRRKLINEVVRLYFQRRRLLREQASAAAKDDELADSIAEVEAVLDGFTDGKFGEAVARGRSASGR
jgi:hypothetical protein